MRLVIDSNIVISALIKDSISRKIIMNHKFYFISPNYILDEIKKYKNLILRKSNLTNEQFTIILSILFTRIDIIPERIYTEHFSKASEEIHDIFDVPFLALALSFEDTGIWSDDKHFDIVSSVKIYKTKDLIDYL